MLRNYLTTALRHLLKQRALRLAQCALGLAVGMTCCLLVLLASVLAAPLAWYAMDSWLQLFTYRTQLDAGVFLAATLVVLLVAWAAVGPFALRAARGNAVDSLRHD
jgi:hypothetical protein